jgi:hypothetical protein
MGRGALRSKRKRARFCAGKAAFSSQEEALQVSPKHNPYVCPHCGAWHLTSKTLEGGVLGKPS